MVTNPPAVSRFVIDLRCKDLLIWILSSLVRKSRERVGNRKHARYPYTHFVQGSIDVDFLVNTNEIK